MWGVVLCVLNWKKVFYCLVCPSSCRQQPRDAVTMAGWRVTGSGPDTSPAEPPTQQHTCNELQHQILKLLTRENFGTANGYSFLCRLAVAGLVITEHYISPTRDYIRHSENSSSVLTLIPWWSHYLERTSTIIVSSLGTDRLHVKGCYTSVTIVYFISYDLLPIWSKLLIS